MGFARDVALKVLHGHITWDNPELVKMLGDEARLLARMRHPNIVAVQWFGQLNHPSQGTVYGMVMEFVHGRTLRRILENAQRELGLMPRCLALDILLDVARGLRYAHELSVDGRPLKLVHRDLKPENVMISRERAVKLLDFGIAKASESLSHKSDVSAVRGTVCYMSPEQMSGSSVDFRSDLFSFGALFFECIVGERLVNAETVLAAIYQVADFELDQRLDRLNGLFDEAVPVLRRLLAPGPAARYQHTAELVRDLQRLRDGVPTDELAAEFLVRQVSTLGMPTVGPRDDTRIAPDVSTPVLLADQDSAASGGWLETPHEPPLKPTVILSRGTKLGETTGASSTVAPPPRRGWVGVAVLAGVLVAALVVLLLLVGTGGAG